MPLRVVRRPDTGALTITGTIRSPDGTRQRVRARAQSDELAIAREEAAALEAGLIRDAWLGKRRQSRTLAEAMIAYLDAEQRPQGTKARLTRLLRVIGDVPLSDLDGHALMAKGRASLKPGATPATVKRGVVVPLRAVLVYAHRRGWCDMPYFPALREPAGRTRYLLPGEALRLLAAAAPHLQVLIEFLLGTGARMAEALELDWRDVDLLGQRVIFWHTKTGVRRDARLPRSTVAALAALPARDGAVMRRPDERPYADRGRASGGQIRTAWTAALRRAELDPALTPHDLRHTWASWHYAVNRDLLALKIEGAWSSVALVERYAHLLPAGHEAAIAAFYARGSEIADTLAARTLDNAG